MHDDIELHKDEPLIADQAYLDAHPLAVEMELNDLTDKGRIFLVIFQTFAYMQIFSILIARRPSYKDLNQFEGMGWETLACVVLLIVIQFFFCYLPDCFGYTTISGWSNLVCLFIGGFSLVWFATWKVFLRIVTGEEQRIRTNKL